MRRPGSLGVSALLSLLFLLAAVGSAAASARPIEGRSGSRRGTTTSTNWSGYAAYGTTFTGAKGSWRQPTANCSSLRRQQRTLAAFWVGLDGYLSDTVEQTGSEADCAGERPVYFAWYELYPNRLFVIAHPVEPGDVLTAEVTQSALRLEDTTAGWEYTESYPAAALDFSSAEWIAEAPSKSLTNFESVAFSSASASSESGSGPITAWTNDKIDLVNHAGPHAILRAQPGELESGGSAFSIGWLHS